MEGKGARAARTKLLLSLRCPLLSPARPRGVAGLSGTSFLISTVRQWWLLREQEALLAEEWATREEEVVGDSPEVH